MKTTLETQTHPAVASERIGQSLRNGGQTVATAESATGGLIAACITEVPGSSDYFLGAVVAYANEIKERLLGVQADTLKFKGAVSPETAREMAEGVRRVTGADIGLADTGIAGPGGASPSKPVGLFYLGLATPTGTEVEELRLTGSRQENREAVVAAALAMLETYLDRWPGVPSARGGKR